MKNHTVEEIQREIQETIQLRRDLEKESYSPKTGTWRIPGNVRKINELTAHISNLKLELNRAKYRNFGEEARRKRNENINNEHFC